MSGVLYVVATPIGNLEDMTYRAVRVLGEVDVIAAEDTRALARLLSHFAIRSPRVLSLFTGNEAARTQRCVDELTAGRDLALVSEAGTPGVSDPGHRLIRAAIAADVRVEVLPGAVAAITALVGSGLPSDRFLFLGFPPRAPGARQRLFGQLRTDPATLILYESPERVPTTLTELAAALGDDRPAVLARELSKRFEEYARGSLAELAGRYRDSGPRGECTLVVQGCDASADAELSAEAIEERMRALLTDGHSAKDAAARLMVVTGRPRRQLYQLALALKRER